MNTTNTPEDAQRIASDALRIDELGGPAEVARLLRYTGSGGTQRVHNWRTRGIPAKVKLERPDLFPIGAQPAASPAPAPAAPTPDDRRAGPDDRRERNEAIAFGDNRDHTKPGNRPGDAARAAARAQGVGHAAP